MRYAAGALDPQVVMRVDDRQLGLDRGLSGPLLAPSAYFMKSPPVQYTDDEARQMVELFAGGEMNPENNFTPRKFSGVADAQQVTGD